MHVRFQLVQPSMDNVFSSFVQCATASNGH